MSSVLWECEVCYRQYDRKCAAEECENLHEKFLIKDFNEAIAATVLKLWRIGSSKKTVGHRLHMLGCVIEETQNASKS